VESEPARPLLRPTLDYDLLVGIELDCILALPAHDSHEAVAPAAKREISHGSSDPDVHTHIAGRNLIAEFPCRRAGKVRAAAATARATSVCLARAMRASDSVVTGFTISTAISDWPASHVPSTKFPVDSSAVCAIALFSISRHHRSNMEAS